MTMLNWLVTAVSASLRRLTGRKKPKPKPDPVPVNLERLPLTDGDGTVLLDGKGRGLPPARPSPKIGGKP